MLNPLPSPLLLALTVLGPVTAFAIILPTTTSSIVVPTSAPSTAGEPLDSFVSYSVELSSFPDYAGNSSNPNDFSYNLLLNIGNLSGSNPIVRVGGNTQDIAIFDSSQILGLVGIVNPAISTDYPSEITIGPAFFESYNTWPGIHYSHGFNLAANSSSARAATVASVAYACKALRNKLITWELGNEPDLYASNSYRATSYNESQYVAEWLEESRAIKAAVEAACPDLQSIKFLAPSLTGTGAVNPPFTLDPVVVWKNGLDTDKNIGIISSHGYMGVSTSPGITLQGTLMNHTAVVANIDKQVNESWTLASLPQDLNPGLPFILGEHNSLAKQGREGLSNSFGATLWGVDFNLYSASHNIRRSHMHQGTNYRYQSWQPIETNITKKGTKAPYYGDVTVAAFLKKQKHENLQITNLPQQSQFESAYSAHVNGSLSRVTAINMREYNATDWNANYTSNFPRPNNSFVFQLPQKCSWKATIQRLIANGSDAVTGITFDGYSYNYELANGKPVLLHNVTRDECIQVQDNGTVSVDIPWSSAAILNLDC